jgi:hypothetical protein
MSKFDKITDLLGEQLFRFYRDDVDAAKEIKAAMDDWATTYHRSYTAIRRIGSARKLWDAVYVAAKEAIEINS